LTGADNQNAFRKIIGTGSFVPERVLTNDDLSRNLGENINDFVSTVIGIDERHVCALNESTADLATAASLRALESARVAPEALDLIILATDTPEYLSPATSVIVQERLGAKNAGTFDVNCACAGFVTALDAATKYVIADAAYRNVLVVGAYVMSKFVDWTEKKTSTIFAAQAAHLLANAQLFEQLRDSEERHRQIFESALDGLYRATTDGRFVTLNPALWTMLGYASADELMDANIVADVFADASIASRILTELNEHGQVLDAECELRRKSGEALPARLSARAVTDKASGEVYHLGIVRNVAEQKRLSEQLKSPNNSRLSVSLAGVAHEVRNPLCGITTTLSAMARRLEDKEAARPFIDVVLKEAGHLNHLMEQLLEHSRPNRIENHPACVRSVLDEAIGERRVQYADKGVALELTCPANLPGVHLDSRKMYGVFANLLDNALQHTAPGGHVAVRVSANVPADEHVTNNVPAINIELSDTGSGIAPADLSKIFEPFYTTRTTGTGLGLAIVRKAIHDHGGRITALRTGRRHALCHQSAAQRRR
jgi:PAS domain S-box-containing protein